MERHVGRGWGHPRSSVVRGDPFGGPSAVARGPFEGSGRAPAAGVFSCVVDQHPRFHLEALRWFAC